MYVQDYPHIKSWGGGGESRMWGKVKLEELRSGKVVLCVWIMGIEY